MDAILNDLTPAIVDIIIPQGSYIEEFFELYEDEEETTPIDLTGIKLESMIRLDYDSSTPVLTLSTDNSEIVVTDPVNGKFKIKYDNISTTNIRFRGDAWEGVRDVEIIDGAGIRKRILQGSFTISREVTR